MKRNPTNPADINKGEIRTVSPKSFEKARVLEVQSSDTGVHTATIKLYDSGSQTTAPVLTPAYGDVALPEEDTDVFVLFGENDEELILGSWYPADRVLRGQIQLPDYDAGDRVVGNATKSQLHIHADGTIDIDTEGTKPLNTDHQSFSVYLQGQQSVSGKSEERVEFDAEKHNEEGIYDFTAHEAVLLNSGLYRLTVTIEIGDAGQNNLYTARIYRNGSVIKRIFRQSAVNEPLTMQFDTSEPLDAGDSIYVTLENGSNAPRNINGNDIGTEFEMRRHGPKR